MNLIPRFLVTFWRRAQMLLHRERISLIEEEEFLKVLRRLGQWDNLQGGLLNCEHCGRQLSISNIAGLVWIRGEHRFICDSTECVGTARKHDKP